MDFQALIKPEFVILVAITYILGMILKKAETFNDKYIPVALMLISISLTALYTFGMYGADSVFIKIFNSVVQGILVTGASNLGYQTVKQLTEK